MALPTAMNNQSIKLITASISESDAKAAFEKVQSQSASGAPITDDVVAAFVQYVAAQGNSDPTAMAEQVLSFLQPYQGDNKAVAIQLFGYSEFKGAVVANEGCSCVGYQQGSLPGVGQNWAIACFVTWH